MTATADAPTDSAVAEFDLDDLLDNVPDPVADALRAMWGHLQAKNEALRDRVDELEGELDNQSQNVSGAFAKLSANEDRIDDLEAQQATVDPANESAHPNEHDDADADTDDHEQEQDRTPLDTICSLPEHLATRELSANQERARFIARDVRDYAEKAPAGLVIDSRAIKRVITAKEGDRPHTQTVARIMEFLDRLGKDAVELRKRRGRKLIAVDPEAADRFASVADHDRCDRGSGPTQAMSVIS